MTTKNQKGFGIVPVLLVLILISIVSFTGYFVWNRQTEKNKEETSQVAGQQDAKSVNQKNSQAKIKSHCLQTQPICFDYPESWSFKSQIQESPLTGTQDSVKVVSQNGTSIEIVTGIDGLGGVCDKDEPGAFYSKVLRVEKNNNIQDAYVVKLQNNDKAIETNLIISDKEPVVGKKEICKYGYAWVVEIPGAKYQTSIRGQNTNPRDEDQLFDIFKSIRQGNN